MIIMALSYTQKSGDTSLLSDNYNLLVQFTEYLIADSLIPANQYVLFTFGRVAKVSHAFERSLLLSRISTDDFAGSLANQTNLAIKGTLAIQAMAEIASILGQTADAEKYTVRSLLYHFAKGPIIDRRSSPSPRSTLPK